MNHIHINSKFRKILMLKFRLSFFGGQSVFITSHTEHSGCYNPKTNGSDYRDQGQFTENGFQCLDWNTVGVDQWNATQHSNAGEQSYI